MSLNPIIISYFVPLTSTISHGFKHHHSMLCAADKHYIAGRLISSMQQWRTASSAPEKHPLSLQQHVEALRQFSARKSQLKSHLEVDATPQWESVAPRRAVTHERSQALQGGPAARSSIGLRDQLRNSRAIVEQVRTVLCCAVLCCAVLRCGVLCLSYRACSTVLTLLVVLTLLCCAFCAYFTVLCCACFTVLCLL